MSEIDAHTLVRLGLIAFILAGGLFLALVPSFLLTALTVARSISLLLLLWIFIWIATILALAIHHVAAVKPTSLPAAPLPIAQPAAPFVPPRPARARPARKPGRAKKRRRSRGRKR